MSLDPTYKLRCSLIGHSMDVRCIAAMSNGIIVTGSRDRTSKVWTSVDNSVAYADSLTLHGHTNFVSCICVLSADDKHPNGLILTGSNDKSICAYTLDSLSPVYRLNGHTNTVCALAVSKFGTVISGSWDQTTRVWLDEKCLMTLHGHTAAVWAVAVVTQQGVIITGSADKTIKLWRAGNCEQTFEGHTDCVRTLAVVSEVEFLSAANDGTIRKWLVTGECVSTVQAHDSFIYSVALLPEGGGYVSTGEDRTLRIWKRGGECRQVIHLPAQSIWAVAVLHNGDIVTGSSDGIGRIFSCIPEQQASLEEIAAYEEEVGGSALSSGELGNIKINELPGREALYEPGKRDGQTKIIRDESKVGVYQWSESETRWIKIGDAVGAAGTQAPGTKIHYEGKEYDYVFDVDIEDGRPALKLPYNITEDPWFAAQKFIENNDLSQAFLDQVANFIMKNTKGMTLGNQQPSSYSDPFTGQSRYVPGGGGENRPAPSRGIDPFTGTGRYVPSFNRQPTETQYFPQKTILSFDSANLTAITGKLKEFNAVNGCGENLLIVDVAIDAVVGLSEAKSRIDPTAIATLEKLLSWPKELVFPVLDVLRLAIRNADICDHFCGGNGSQEFLRYVLNHFATDSPPSNKMLSVRILCNMMAQETGVQLALENRGNILERALQLLPCDNKNIQIAFATLILNYAVILFGQGDLEAKLQCLSGILEIVNDVSDGEAQFRLLVAIGTLAVDDEDSLTLSKSLEVLPALRRLKSVTEPKKVAGCASDLERILS